jgi:hypothetical protein
LASELFAAIARPFVGPEKEEAHMNQPTRPEKPADSTSAKATPDKETASNKAPPAHPWDAIGVGRTVLYQASKAEGWFECLVTAISKDGKTLTLKWRDYTGFKPFDVRRLSVGLICKMD